MEDKEFHKDILDSMNRARREAFRPYHPGVEILDNDEGNCRTKGVSR